MSSLTFHAFSFAMSLALGVDGFQQIDTRWPAFGNGEALQSGGTGDSTELSARWSEPTIQAGYNATEVVNEILPESSQEVGDVNQFVAIAPMIAGQLAPSLNGNETDQEKSRKLLDSFFHWLQAILHRKSNAQVVTAGSSESSETFGNFVWEGVDCGYPTAAGLVIEMRVKNFEDSSLNLLLEALCPTCDQKNVTDSLAYADHVSEAIRGCEINGKDLLLSRVNLVAFNLASASRHRNLLLSGVEDVEAFYPLSDDLDFAPPMNCSSTEAVDWFITKVAGVESATQTAIASKQGLDEAYHYAHRLSLSMVRVLSLRKSMDAKDSQTLYSKKVIQVFRQRVDAIETLLRNNGAVPSAIVEAVRGTNGTEKADQVLEAIPLVQVNFDPWTPVNCTERRQAAVTLKKRVGELEDKSLVSMLVAICSKCDHKSVVDTLSFLRHLQNTLRMCPVSEQRTLLARVNAVEIELVRASHHMDLVARGRDPNGLYKLDDKIAFIPKAGISPIKAAQFFIGKVASLDLMMREAIQTGEQLDEAYHYAHRVIRSMNRFLSHRSNLHRDNFEVARARLVVERLKSHMQNVQGLLRGHGAQPRALKPPTNQ